MVLCCQCEAGQSPSRWENIVLTRVGQNLIWLKLLKISSFESFDNLLWLDVFNVMRHATHSLTTLDCNGERRDKAIDTAHLPTEAGVWLRGCGWVSVRQMCVGWGRIGGGIIPFAG